MVSGSPLIVNGLSCMACHDTGMKRGFKDDVIAGHRLAGAARDIVEQLYLPAEKFDQLLAADEARFLAALDKAIGPYLKIGSDNDKRIEQFADPITEVASGYNNRPITLEMVAAELGVADVAQLQSQMKLPALRGLGLAGLGDNKSIKRGLWQQKFHEAASLLEVGVRKQVTKSDASASNVPAQ